MTIAAAEDCVGVVLAGGRSRRMGRDKALLEWRGHTLLEHAIARFRDAGVTEVVVSGNRPEHDGLPDVHADAGPLGGLHAVMRAFPGRYLVVVPVDMPKLPAEWLRLLMRQAERAHAVHFAGSPLPLAMRAQGRLVAMLDARVNDAQSPRSIRTWLCDIAAEALPMPSQPHDALVNANSTDDWIRILRSDSNG